jgi:hypothetical protein
MRFHLCILDLSITELRLIQDTAAAAQQGRAYLPAPRWAKAARRLIARGFVTGVDEGWATQPPADWVALKLTPANLLALEAAAEVPMAGRPEYPPMTPDGRELT